MLHVDNWQLLPYAVCDSWPIVSKGGVNVVIKEPEMSLAVWMAAKNETDTSLADKLGLDRSLIFRVRKGERDASDGFKLAFNRAFGYNEAHRLYPRDFPLPFPMYEDDRSFDAACAKDSKYA